MPEFFAERGSDRLYLEEKNGTYVLKREHMRPGDRLVIGWEGLDARAGGEGFFLLPGNQNAPGCALIRFRDRADGEIVSSGPILSLFAVKNAGGCFAVMPERTYRYEMRAQVRGGKYSLRLILDLEKQPLDGDFVIRLLRLDPEADHNDVAAAVRKNWLERGIARTLKDKCACRSEVDYARRYPLVRIRMGWKPAPPEVLHQTVENEPEMYVGCTFERVREIADEMKRQGVEGAEISLVGWNIRGHDGRWPQIFPVEEGLGGEEELRKTIAHCQKLGYRITCHTNSMDHYEIADSFSFEDLAVDRAGKYSSSGQWSGGQGYRACPHVQAEYARRDLPRVAELGFRGLHYVDVLSIVEPDVCFQEGHVCSFAQAVKRAEEIMEVSRELFGGFASEGCMDFALPGLDFSLYNSFGSFYALPGGLCDEYVPYDLFYHGLMLYNSCTETVNYAIKDKKSRLIMGALGGRPAFYFNSKFKTSGNWMGECDLRCDSREEIVKSVAAIKGACDEYAFFAERQLHFIDSFRRHEGRWTETIYDDGVRVIANLTEETMEAGGMQIGPLEYGILPA